jgi:acyl-[acyl-carrier-protein]-phospholipid O-acyltransferase/long-chain-fatty-acid--[acyl-carrier-protein] ligase
LWQPSFKVHSNDNAYKNLIVFIILGTAIEKADRDRLVLVAGALFSVPFILFSMTGGYLADRYSKRTVTIGTKWFEIGVMAFAIAGLAWQNLHLEMAAILASTQAAFFGPSKYGLLPDLLPEPKLSWHNGVIELLFPRNLLKTRTGYPMGVCGSHNHPKGVAGA